MFDFMKNESLKDNPSFFYLDGYTKDMSKSEPIREGLGRYNLYSKAPIYINSDELIVCNLNWAVGNEVFTNITSHQIINYDLLDKMIKSYFLSHNKKNEIKEKINLVKEYSLNNIKETYSYDERLVSDSGTGMSNHWNGHMVLDFKKVLTKGLNYILDEIIEYKTKASNLQNIEFYEGFRLTLEGMQMYILRHSEMAKYLLENNIEGYDSEKLQVIINTCRKISTDAPENFLEALQLSWFMFAFGDYDSFGRFDIYLYDFYKKDKNTLSEDTIIEYLKYFLNKTEENKGILNMTIGGINTDGTSSVNELTYLILRAVRENGYKSPNLCLRITDDAPKELYEEVHKNLATGQAIPALYNDKIIIPMLIEMGIEEEDAYGYCLAGCSQVIIPGKSNYNCDIGVYNTLKMLELALSNGYDKRLNRQVSVRTGDIKDFNTFNDLYNAYSEQMKYAVKIGVEINNKDIIARQVIPSNVRTIFTEGCLESGKSIFHGGAKYNAIQSEIIGLTNVANSLYVIKKLVYDNKELSLERLVEILDNNYIGMEYFRQHLIRDVEKFGNNHDEIDELRGKIGREIYEEMSSYDSVIGGKHWPGEVIFQSHLETAPYTLASADGRLSYSPLADSAGAVQGTDMLGPTALIKSMSKIPYTHPTVCRNLNLRFNKNIFNDSKESVIALFRVFFKLKGCQLQINVLDVNELIAAQKDPEKYKSLVVRIGGFNAYFTELSKEMQDEVISRTEQAI